MDKYMSDKEQVEMLKDYWNRYGKSIIIALLIVMGANFSWQYWHGYKMRNLAQASAIYDRMFMAFSNNQITDFKLLAEDLKTDYHGTPYASLAELNLASYKVTANKLKDAVKELDWVVRKGHNDFLRQIARIREARVLLALKNPEQALKLLKKVNDKTYISYVDEVRGDAYLTMNDSIQASKFYELALQKRNMKDATYPLLKMKIADLLRI